MKALKNQDGELYRYVTLAQLYEQRLWTEASDMAGELGLSEHTVMEMMNRATKWADEIPVGFGK